MDTQVGSSSVSMVSEMPATGHGGGCRNLCATQRATFMILFPCISVVVALVLVTQRNTSEITGTVQIIGLALIFASSIVSVLVLRFTNASLRAVVEATALIWTVGTIILDWRKAAEAEPRRLTFVVIILDMCLTVGARPAVPAVIIVSTLLWLGAERLEATANYALHNAALYGETPEVQVCSCASPPCAVSYATALSDFITFVTVFVTDYYLTRMFAREMREQQQIVAAASKVSEEVVVLLADYLTDPALDIVANCGEQLPRRMHLALLQMVTNLKGYKPYLPDAVLSGSSRAAATLESIELTEMPTPPAPAVGAATEPALEAGMLGAEEAAEGGSAEYKQLDDALPGAHGSPRPRMRPRTRGALVPQLQIRTAALLCAELSGLRDNFESLTGQAVEALSGLLLTTVLDTSRAGGGILYMFEEGAAVVAFGAVDCRPTACVDACRCALAMAGVKQQFDAAAERCLKKYHVNSLGHQQPGPLPTVGSVHQGVDWDRVMAGETGTRERRSFTIMGPALACVRALSRRGPALGASVLVTDRVWRRVRSEPSSTEWAVGRERAEAPGVFELSPATQYGFSWGTDSGTIIETDEIGTGSYGSVCKALGPHGELLAVKHVRLGAGRAAAREARAEVESVSKQSHPNIVEIYMLMDPAREGSSFRIVMEFMAGGTVASMLKEFGPLRRTTCASYTAQAFAGLAHLHERNVIHSDVRPTNLLVQVSGAVKLAEYGLTRRAAEKDDRGATTISGAAAGSSRVREGGSSVSSALPYMSPLQLTDGRFSAQSDLWSAGCTLLEMATGGGPWADRGWGKSRRKWVQGIKHCLVTGDRPTGAAGSSREFLSGGSPLPSGLVGFAGRCFDAERAANTAQALLTDPFIIAARETRDAIETRHQRETQGAC